MYNWPISDLWHFYYTWIAPRCSETIYFGIIVKSAIRTFRKHILYIGLSIFYITQVSKCPKMAKIYDFTLFPFFQSHPVIFKATLLMLSQFIIHLVCLGTCIIYKLGVLEQVYGLEVQLKPKSHKKENVRERTLSASTTNYICAFKEKLVPTFSVPPI